MTGRKLLGLIGSLALTAVLIVGVVWAARSSGSGGEGAAVAPLVTQTPTSVATPAPATLAPTSTASPSASPTPLPEPDAGYNWHEVAPNAEYGWLAYAVQVPEGWSLPGTFSGNPVSFKPEDATNPPGPALVVQVAEATFLTGTPHLFYWLLPHHGGDCQEIVRTAQQIRPAYTWDTFSYTCTTRDPDNPEAHITLSGLAAEVRVGEFVFSIATRQPPDSTASEAAFQKAIDILTLQ